jgi:hypothetical protein
MGFLMAKDDEPIVLYWIGQATNPRLKARYWLQVALFNIIIYAVLIVSSPGLIFFIPALIVAIKVSSCNAEVLFISYNIIGREEVR